MKTKLLRKVRKNFSIISYPNGLKAIQMFLHINTLVKTLTLNDGNHITDYCVVTPSNGPEYRLHGVKVCKNEKEAFKYLQSIMISRVLSKYEEYGVRRIAKRQVAEKLYLKNESKDTKTLS